MCSQVQTAQRLDDAYAAFAADDGWDHRAAYDYREEGYDLASEAFAGSHDDEQDVIEGGVLDAPESARELVAAAAWFRLAELKAAASVMERAA